MLSKGNERVIKDDWEVIEEDERSGNIVNINMIKGYVYIYLVEDHYNVFW